MIFILKRKGIHVGKFGHIETEEVELQSGTEEVPIDTVILKTDMEQDLVSESEAASEYDRRDETSEPENEISNLLREKDNDIFVRPVIDDEGNEEPESAFVGLNTEPTEDTEEVRLSMRMSREDLMKELKKEENRAKMYLKSGTVKRNIQKIIREYRAHEDEEETKSEDGTKTAQAVKQGADVQLREPEFPKVTEENDNEMHAQGAHAYTDQVTDKPGLDNHRQTGRQQETDHPAVDAEMNVDVSQVPSDSVTYEDHDTEREKGKKGLKKLIKKYKMLDESRDAEPPTADDRMMGNGTGHEKKPIQKIRPDQQIFKKDILEEGGDFETITEPKETSVPIENETIENDNTELNGFKKNEGTNEIVSEMYNVTAGSNVNLQDLDSGIIENELPSQNSRHKKRATNEVIKELHGDRTGTDMSVTEEPGEVHVSGNETPTPTNRKKPAIRKVKEKFRSSDDTEHAPQPDNLVRNAGETDNMYEQDTPVDKNMPTKNGINMQEDETVSDKIEPMANTAYLAQLPERSTEEYDKPTKEMMIDAVHPKEIPYGVSVGPEGLTLQSSASVDEKTQISEPSEDLKLSKQKPTSSEASQNAGNIRPVLRDKHKTESDEEVESENVAKGKLGEDIIQM
jgi:hypothetical protein